MRLQEADIEHRTQSMRREGSWATKRLTRLTEPPRPKVHWDYLCEEMQWLSADFAQERRWKRGVARKVGRAWIIRVQPPIHVNNNNNNNFIIIKLRCETFLWSGSDFRSSSSRVPGQRRDFSGELPGTAAPRPGRPPPLPVRRAPSYLSVCRCVGVSVSGGSSPQRARLLRRKESRLWRLALRHPPL